VPRKVSLTVIILLLLPLCGCWDSRDLDKLNFPLAASYDLHSPGSADPSDPPTPPGRKLMDVTTMTPNLAPKSSAPVDIQTLSGINATDVRQKRALIDPDTYVTGLLKTIIIGEEMASLGINPYMDALLRGTTISGTMYFAVAAGRGEDILKTPIKNDTNIGTYLLALFDGIHQRTFIPVIRLGEFYRSQDTGKNPVAPILERKGDRVIISGVAVFKKDQMVKKLNLEEGQMLVLLRGIAGESYQPFMRNEAGKKHWGSVLVSNSRKVKYYQDQQGHNFLITIKLTGNLDEHSHQGPVTEKHLKEIEKTVEQQVKNQCEKFIKKMQEEIKVDCIDISKYALTKNRRALEKEIDNPEFIQYANIKVMVKVHLDKTGEAR